MAESLFDHLLECQKRSVKNTIKIDIDDLLPVFEFHVPKFDCVSPLGDGPGQAKVLYFRDFDPKHRCFEHLYRSFSPPNGHYRNIALP